MCVLTHGSYDIVHKCVCWIDVYVKVSVCFGIVCVCVRVCFVFVRMRLCAHKSYVCLCVCCMDVCRIRCIDMISAIMVCDKTNLPWADVVTAFFLGETTSINGCFTKLEAVTTFFVNN